MKFNRGFEPCREKVVKSVKYSRSCFNCNSYYKSVGEHGEMCQNPNVTEFDMVVTENNVYCTYWTPVSHNKSGTLFKNGGRSELP